MNSRKAVAWALRGIFAAVIVGLIVRYADMPELISHLKALSPWFFSLAFLAAITDKVVVSFKWSILLDLYRVGLPRSAAFVATFRAKVFGVIAPSSLGADGYKIWYCRQNGGPLKATVASIVVERGLGLLSSVALILLLLPASLAPFALPRKTLLLVLGYGLFVVILAVVKGGISAAPGQVGLRLPRWIPGGVRGRGENLLRCMADVGGRERGLWVYFWISVLEKGFYGLTIWLCALALGFQGLPLLYALGATPLLSILSKIPVSLGAIGVREGLMVGLLLPFLPSAEQGLAVALTLRFVDLFMVGLSGAAWMVRKPPTSLRETVAAVGAESRV